jgi:hypothetical protein
MYIFSSGFKVIQQEKVGVYNINIAFKIREKKSVLKALFMKHLLFRD